MKENKVKESREELPTFNHRKLGTAQDSKLFQYSYYPKDYTSIGKQVAERTFTLTKIG